MEKTVDFANLSVKDALDLAILIEDEARERYEEFVDQMKLHHTPEAAEFFSVMAANETKHGEQLARRRREMFKTEPSQISRAMLWDVEAPDYDKTRAFMSVRQAMQVALESEIKARDYFSEALKHVVDEDVRKLFRELREEEAEHRRLVQMQLDKLPPDSDANPEDYSDEPVAQ